MAQHTWLTVAEFAAELGISEKVAYRWFAAGHATGLCPRFIRAGRVIRIRRDWFDAWAEERADDAA